MKEKLKAARQWCADMAWGFWMLLTGWREWRAEERQIEMECEEERMKAIWQAQRMKERERTLEAAGRAA